MKQLAAPVLIAVTALIVCAGLAGCEANRAQGQSPSHGDAHGHADDHHEETPELAAFMGDLQRHGQKLGYAIEGRNQRLAEFYLHEVEEVLAAIKAEVPVHDELPIAQTIATIMEPDMPQMHAAIDSADWSAATTRYSTLIENCNRCHTATEHEFIVILPATGTPPFNQKFDL